LSDALTRHVHPAADFVGVCSPWSATSSAQLSSTGTSSG
jgi:hypothetical protein